SVIDEAVYKELDDSLVRAATTASSLEAEQESGNINKTTSKATPNESISQGTDSGGGPRCQEAMGDTIAQTRSERVSKLSNDSLLIRGNILQSDEDSIKLNELMELCTTLQTRVLDLEKIKTSQALEIDSLKRRVKKLEKKQRSRTHKLKRVYKVGLTFRVESLYDEQSLGEDASKQERISDIDADEGITLVSTHDDAKMFDADKDLHGEEVFATKQDKNLAQALAELKHTKPKAKAKGIVFHEPKKSTTTATIPKLRSQDKGKDVMIEEPVKIKKKDQIMFDEEVALKFQAELQAEFDEEEQRLARESAQKEQEVNSDLIEEWNDIQAKIDADYQLAERLQAEEQQELNDAEKATLFMQLLEKRRKFFAANRAEEKRNKPPTRAQQRSIMCTYLKNIEGWKLNSLKNKFFANIQELFDKAIKRMNTFVDYNTELVEESSKKGEAKVMEESSKRA
nr:hypothetical protein [Tanacetum cinerariifolium]